MINNSKVLLERLLRPLTSAKWLKSIEDRKIYLEKLHDSRLSNPDDLKIFKKHLKELESFCEDNSVKLLIVLIPDAAQLNNPRVQKTNSILNQYCVDLQIPIVDITKVFENQEDIPSLYHFPLDANTSVKGNSMIAKEVYKKIHTENLIKQ